MRLDVKKTYKLFIGGQFPRSESGRSYEITSPQGVFLANAAQASRKDLRDAVTAARSAFSNWSQATAFNRGQILYRIAEMLEGRREQFEAELKATGDKPKIIVVLVAAVTDGCALAACACTCASRAGTRAATCTSSTPSRCAEARCGTPCSRS